MIEKKHDPITGRETSTNPLNKKNLSKYEFDEIFNNMFETDNFDAEVEEYEDLEYSSQECYN
ncbi:MAG: hypothetical protein D4S01_07285 [Dehalococcoidia bacterium]|nr:MAG: hypothetical protein D4S01_07285 [Dehalococcoidia bacterium]